MLRPGWLLLALRPGWLLLVLRPGFVHVPLPMQGAQQCQCNICVTSPPPTKAPPPTQTDPEAAKIVFESGVPLTMVPLEVTHTALADAAVLNAVLGCGSTDPMDATIPAPGAVRAASAFRAKMVDLLMFFATTYKEVFKFESPPLHDPCAVAYVIAPQLFEVEVMRVVRGVETQLYGFFARVCCTPPALPSPSDARTGHRDGE